MSFVSPSSVLGLGGISHDGMFEEDSQYPWNLAAGIAYANIGSAMAVDTTAPAQAKLCGASDIILGRLEQVENRIVEGTNIGVINMEGGMTLPIDTTAVSGTTPTPPGIGDSVQGSATPGTVMRLAPAQGRGNIVTAVSTDGTTCTVLFL